MEGFQGISSGRETLQAEYAGSKAPYRVQSRPYYSTGQFALTVVDGNASNAKAVLKTGQKILFYSYKIGDAIPFGPPGSTKIATESDTNLGTARHTNGVEDFVSEGMSLTCKGLRLNYVSPVYSGSDSDVRAAWNGLGALYDPASIIAVPQLFSPFNLENAIDQAVRKQCSLEAQIDRHDIEKFWRADQVPEGGASSYLKTQGEPSTQNRVRQPEGLIWRRSGMPASELVFTLTVDDPVVIPISLVNPDNANLNGANATPQFLFIDYTLRLHGWSLTVPGQN